MILIRQAGERIRLSTLTTIVLACFCSQIGDARATEVILYRVEGFEPAGSTAAGVTVSRAGGESVPLQAGAALQLGDRVHIDPPARLVRLCGVHHLVLSPGDFEILNGGAIRQRHGQLAYDVRPCTKVVNTRGERVFELLFGEGDESIPLGVLGTRFLAEARANKGSARVPGLAGAGLASLRVVVGEGEVVLGRRGSEFYRFVASGRTLLYSASGAAERGAEAAELAELNGLLGPIAATEAPTKSSAEPSAFPAGNDSGSMPRGSDALTRGPGGASHVPLVRRPWFWGVLGAAAATLTASGIAIGVVCSRGIPEPTLGRIGAP